jgi:hypothetical protein
MAWRQIAVPGLPTRSAVEYSARTPDVTIDLLVEDDVIPPHTVFMFGMWFIVITVTGVETTADGDLIDSPDDPMTSACFTGTITGTDIPVRLTYFGEVFDCFEVDIDS